MVQFIKENTTTVLPLVFFVAWFVCTCINGFYQKKQLYVLELVVLFVGFVCDILLACFSVFKPGGLEIAMMLLAYAAASIIMLWMRMKDFYRYYNDQK